MYASAAVLLGMYPNCDLDTLQFFYFAYFFGEQFGSDLVECLKGFSWFWDEDYPSLFGPSECWIVCVIPQEAILSFGEGSWYYC